MIETIISGLGLLALGMALGIVLMLACHQIWITSRTTTEGWRGPPPDYRAQAGWNAGVIAIAVFAEKCRTIAQGGGKKTAGAAMAYDQIATLAWNMVDAMPGRITCLYCGSAVRGFHKSTCRGRP